MNDSQNLLRDSMEWLDDHKDTMSEGIYKTMADAIAKVYRNIENTNETNSENNIEVDIHIEYDTPDIRNREFIAFCSRFGIVVLEEPTLRGLGAHMFWICLSTSWLVSRTMYDFCVKPWIPLF